MSKFSFVQVLTYCIKQAYKIAKDENDVGSCWFAEKWLSAIKSELTKK